MPPGIEKFDLFFSNAFRSLQNPFLDVFTHALTAITYGGALWVVLAAVLWRRGSRLLAVQICAAIVVGLFEASVLKHIFHRERPTVIELYDFWMPFHTFFADKWSFPSGHATLSFAAAGVIFYKFRDWRGLSALALAALIGACRVYQGMHWPTDVLVGTVIGLVASVISVAMVRKLLPAVQDDVGAAAPEQSSQES